MASTVPFGGHDCEFVAPPPSAFQVDCAICVLKLRDPQQVSCCGKSFCDPCIKRHQLRSQQCPTCNSPFTTFANKGLKQSLMQLHVYCTHHGDGCGWTGELGQLDQHLNENSAPGGDGHGCPFAEVKCIHCSKKFQRRRHPFESCPKRQVNCHYYNQGCRWKGELTKLEQHVNKKCIHAVVNCTFHYAGCEVQLPSKDMPAHMAESVGTHLQLLGAQNQKLGALIERLKVMMIWLVIIVSAVIIVLAVIIISATHATQSNVTPLQGQWHTVESNSSIPGQCHGIGSNTTSLHGQCHAMEANITALERQYRSIEAMITSLHGPCHALESNITALERQYRSIEAMITSLHGPCHALESNITALERQYRSIEAMITSLHGQCHAMVSNITALERQYRSIEAMITLLQQQYHTCTIKEEFTTRPPVQDNIEHTHKGFFMGGFITLLRFSEWIVSQVVHVIVVVLVAAGWLFAVILKFVTCLSVVMFVAFVLKTLIEWFNEVAGRHGVVHMSQEQTQRVLGCIWLIVSCYLMYCALH